MRLHSNTLLALGLLAVIVLVACAGQPSGTPSAPGRGDAAYVDVPPAQLAEMLVAKDFIFVNVHTPYEGEIAQTDEFLPFDEVDSLLAALPDRDAKIVLYCRSGSMSTTAAQALVASGYTNVWNLDGGMIAWRAAGYTVVERPPT